MAIRSIHHRSVIGDDDDDIRVAFRGAVRRRSALNTAARWGMSRDAVTIADVRDDDDDAAHDAANEALVDERSDDDDDEFVFVDAREVEDAVRDFVQRCVCEYVVVGYVAGGVATPERVRACAKRAARETRLGETASRRRWRAMKTWTRRAMRATRALSRVCDRLSDPWTRRVIVLSAWASGRAAWSAAYWMMW